MKSEKTQDAIELIKHLHVDAQAQVYALVAIAEALERIAAVQEGQLARDGRPVIKRGRPRTVST